MNIQAGSGSQKWRHPIFLFVSLCAIFTAGVEPAEAGDGVISSLVTPNLSWGTNGQGGSGTWDFSSTNWWDGSNSVAWTSGGSALFSGPGGTVTVDGPTVSQIAFTGGEYHLNGRSLRPSNSLRFICDTDGWVNVTILASSSNTTTIQKSGSATLHLGSSLFLAKDLLVEEGTLRMTTSRAGSSSLVVHLGPSVGTELVLAAPINNIVLAGLSGGLSGSVVRPEEGAPALLTLYGLNADLTSVFNGQVLDAPGGTALSLAKQGASTQVLRGTNSYSGPTSVRDGALILSGDGVLLNSAVSLSRSGVMVLDNEEKKVSGRLPADQELTMSGGNLRLTGYSGDSVVETVGTLRFSRQATLTIESAPDGPATLQVNELLRENGGTLMVKGSGSVTVPTIPEGFFLGPVILRDGNHWGVAGGNGRILPFTDYVSLATAGPEDHVDLTEIPEASLAQSKEIASLRAYRDAGVTSALKIAADAELTLRSGGILLAGGEWSINGGTIGPGVEQELVAYVNGTLILGSAVSDTIPETTVTKTGPGRLELGGINTYTGNTMVADGTLWAANDSALGRGQEVTLPGGVLAVSGTMISKKSLAVPPDGIGTLSVSDGLAAFSQLRNENILVVSGAGGLHLTQGGVNLGRMNVSGGRLVASGLAGGVLALLPGRAEITGRIDSLSVSSSPGPSVLAIGGDESGSLDMLHLNLALAGPSAALVVEYNFGTEQSDFLRIGGVTGSARIAVRPIQPEILEVGMTYPLVEFSEPAARYRTAFTLDPDLDAHGWRATFVADGEVLSMVICATPETQMTLAEALAAPALAWTTGGDQEWKAEPCGYPSGGDSVNTGLLPFGAESWLETTIAGPGLLSFQWMGGDLAQVSVGEKLVISTSSPPGYWKEAQIQLPASPQIVRWRTINQWSTSPPYPKMHLADLQFRPETFESWGVWHGLDGAAASPEHDLRGEGLPNQIRYALGIHPDENGHARLPQVSLRQHVHENSEADFLTLVFERPFALGDVTFIVEKSTDLADWAPLQTAFLVEELPDGVVRVTARDDHPIDGRSARFLRLRIARSP